MGTRHEAGFLGGSCVSRPDCLRQRQRQDRNISLSPPRPGWQSSPSRPRCCVIQAEGSPDLAAPAHSSRNSPNQRRNSPHPGCLWAGKQDKNAGRQAVPRQVCVLFPELCPSGFQQTSAHTDAGEGQAAAARCASREPRTLGVHTGTHSLPGEPRPRSVPAGSKAVT